MTQQEIVNIVNSNLIDFNIDWARIKYAADKAIIRINSYLCTKYPSMSSILLSPKHTYSIRVNGHEKEIFPDTYIHTVVIPYICMELLAQDEEFTTIYNKFAMDVEDGLFTMFQNEFYRVPLVFRQPEDTGVLFDVHTTHYKIREERDQTLPVFTFKVYYHVNNSEIMLSKQFTFDDKVYNYEDTCTVLPCTEIFNMSVDGSTVYEFKGWSKEQRIPTDYVNPGDDIKLTEDLHLYAIWDKSSTLTFDNTGAVVVNPVYAQALTTLVVPIMVDGYPVSAIGQDFADGCVNLTTLVLPKTLNNINTGAFAGATHLQTIVFPEYDYLYNRPNINIEGPLFNSSIVLDHVYLPYSIRNISPNAFNCVISIIECECLLSNKPVGWAMNGELHSWAGPNTDIRWGVTHG